MFYIFKIPRLAKIDLIKYLGSYKSYQNLHVGLWNFMYTCQNEWLYLMLNAYTLKQWSLHDPMGIGTYFKVSFGEMVWFKTSVRQVSYFKESNWSIYKNSRWMGSLVRFK